MEFSNQIIIFLLGFFSGAGIIALLYYFLTYKKVSENKENDDLVSSTLSYLYIALDNKRTRKR